MLRKEDYSSRRIAKILSYHHSKIARELKCFNNDYKAYKLKELFYEYILTQTNKEDTKRCLKEWIRRAEISGLKEYKDCIRCFTNWFEEITNSHDYPYADGQLEGFHTKRKT